MASLLLKAVLVFLVFTASALDPYSVISKTSNYIDAPRGSTFELSCDANNRPNGISSETRIPLKWELTRDGSEDRVQLSNDRLPINEQKYGLKFENSDTYVLIIKNVDPTDSGTYYCKLQLTRYITTEDFVHVRVIEAPRINPMLTSSDLTATIGTTVNLTCDAFGEPKPLITWTRAGNGIMPGGGFSRVGTVLTIPGIKPQDGGPYICSGSNRIGEAFRTIDVRMIYAPQVTAYNPVIEQKEGYEVRLVCRVDSGGASTSISWMYGNSEFDTSRGKITTYESAFDRTISKLTIYKVKAEDYSTPIRCSAVSSLVSLGSSNIATFTIQRADNPVPVAGQIRSSAVAFHSSLAIMLMALFGLLL